MYKISELIGKQVITLSDAGSRGVILSAFFDSCLSKCKCFLLLSDDEESNYYVDYKNLASIFGDAVVVRSHSDLSDSLSESVVTSPINQPAFNQDGKSLGTVRDINMEGAAVVSFVTDICEVPAGTLLSRSDDIIVFNDTGRPIKIKKPVKKEKPAEPAEKDALPQILGKAEENLKIETPIKVASDYIRAKGTQEALANPATNKYSFLLGKRLQRSIYTNDGKLVARENDLITERLIAVAKSNNKLVALALHSL